MSALPEASVKGRFAARRRELLAKTTLEPMPVPGYDGLYVRYRILGYEDVRIMGLKNEEEAPTVAEGEKWTAADILVDACVELMELKGMDVEDRPIFETLPYRWTAPAATELFEVEGLPSDAGGREAILAIFPYPHDMLMMTHFQEYVSQAGIIDTDVIEKQLLGESRAASVGT